MHAEMAKMEDQIDKLEGEDDDGKIVGRHRGTGIGRPRFWERAQYYNLERDLATALDELD